jgi:hypothetical protein
MDESIAQLRLAAPEIANVPTRARAALLDRGDFRGGDEAAP